MPLQAIHTGLWPAITRRENPPSSLGAAALASAAAHRSSAAGPEVTLRDDESIVVRPAT